MGLVGISGVDHHSLVALTSKRRSVLPVSFAPVPLGTQAYLKVHSFGPKFRTRHNYQRRRRQVSAEAPTDKANSLKASRAFCEDDHVGYEGDDRDS